MGAMPNHLAAATSPYLLQHKDNPVDWREWGDEAFAAARERDVPVLLSVGYAACHWCHVMAHESFEDDVTAAAMNADFVCVKVDREERPDVDAVYMRATTALTGQGGWPMTVFLTPDGRPFYAGTYFPPQARHGLPSFGQLLTAIAASWRERRGEVVDASQRIAAGLAAAGPQPDQRPPDADDLAAAVRLLAREHDEEHGGFGGAPKFPPSMVLEWLLRHAARVGDTGTGALALSMASNTLRHMALSGTYDQVEGGFARYAVDARWVVPHFEKMLYDNALLARVYLHWWRLTGDLLGRRVALETCDWMLAALGTAQGGLASALDADTAVAGSTHGVEGLTYVWTPTELAEVLGPDDGAWVAELTAVTAAGTFEHGASTLQLTRDPYLDPADPADASRWKAARARLAAARAARPQPARDDKVVTAWNGLAVAALAETGALLDRRDLVDAARSAAALLLSTHRPDGRLRRVSRDGVVGAPSAVLEDHGDLVEGLVALYAVTGEARWAHAAGEVVTDVLDRFVTADGSLSDTALDDVDPVLRNASGGEQHTDPSDNAYPGGTASAAGALLSWSALSGDGRARAAAERALAPGRRIAGGAPRFAGWSLAVAEALVDGPREVAVVGAADDPLTASLWAQALRGNAPGLVVAVGAGGEEPAVALLRDRAPVGGAALAYPCRGQVCDLPVADVEALQRFTLGRVPG